MPDTRPKASQWSFTVSYTADIIERLGNLTSHPDVCYVTFATINNDNGSRHVEGFIKTSRRCRVNTISELVGPAILSIVVRPTDALLSIQLHPFQESGEDARTSSLRLQIAGMKSLIKDGYDMCDLIKSYPDLCTRNPHLIWKFVSKPGKPFVLVN